MYQPTIEKLHALRLGAMANALTAQLQQPEIDAMPFSERLALLVDIQHSAMLTAALEQRLSRAGMRQSACVENLDLRTPRGLDRSTMQALAGGLWIRQHRNVLVSGPAGIGKSWIACTLATRLPATASRCSTSACRGCSTTWPWRGCMAARRER
jgi:DNA replication protein DnaC